MQYIVELLHTGFFKSLGGLGEVGVIQPDDV